MKKERKRSRYSTVHFTIWSMNGSPIPDPIVKRIEEAMQSQVDGSDFRLLANVWKG